MSFLGVIGICGCFLSHFLLLQFCGEAYVHLITFAISLSVFSL
jgi:hypothetical protein